MSETTREASVEKQPETPAERAKRLAQVRASVRKSVQYGRWREADDPDRTNAYLSAREHRNSPRGREALQGDTNDFQSVAFLPAGADIRRCIASIQVRLPRSVNVGTGFLVSPGLLLTNFHVIGDDAAARATVVTFDFENDFRQVPRQTSAFRLDPATFAIYSAESDLDYALVALGERLSGDIDLAEFPRARLSDRPDKHALGMYVNIIQHPQGWPKMLAIRNNLLVARTERTLLYETDTESGSSGAPVFNDDWELIALHHWGEPFLERVDDQGQPIAQTVNEGVRISAIYRDLARRKPELTAQKLALLEEALAAPGESGGPGPRTLSGPRPQGPESLALSTFATGAPMATRPNELTLTIPITITIRAGDAPGSTVVSLAQAQGAAAAAPAAPKMLQRGAEALKIDENYGERDGYDATFIPQNPIAMPEPGEKMKKHVAPLRAGEKDAAKGILKYEHFSAVMHKTKRLAMFTATNINGKTYLTVNRDTGRVEHSEAEKWFTDPRISESFIVDQTFYSGWSTYFDRGHLTRRTDVTWGSVEDAERANADTFHFTNCSPQHFRFNQTADYWQGVERYVLENGALAEDSRAHIVVFQGPIWNNAIDLWADDVQIPSSFWKIVVWKANAGLKAVGLVVDQLDLLTEVRKSLGAPRDLPSVDVAEWREPIAQIAKRSGLVFDPAVVAADTIAQPGQPAVGAEARIKIASWEQLL